MGEDWKLIPQRRLPDGLKTAVGGGAAERVTQLWSMARDRP